MTAPIPTALRAGVRRGVVEFLNSLRSPTDVGFWIVGAIVTVVVLWFLRTDRIAELDITTAQFIFPGLLAVQLLIAATWGVGVMISTEREDGTLLRAKALPHGTLTYATGITMRSLLESAVAVALVLVPSLFLVGGLLDRGPVALAAVGILVLGFVALFPIGLAVGALSRNPRAVSGWGLLVGAAVVFASGIFVPLITFPEWAQVIGQLLPLYWLGLLLRSVLLPENLHVVEIGESWRTLEAFGVLGAWAVVGILIAPPLLRRMARRESGTSLERARQKALQRV
jgi:ABC-type multidrug transport system, permease component